MTDEAHAMMLAMLANTVEKACAHAVTPLQAAQMIERALLGGGFVIREASLLTSANEALLLAELRHGAAAERDPWPAGDDRQIDGKRKMIDGVTFTMVPDDDDEARRQGFSEELIRDLGPADSGTVIMDPKAGQAYCRSLSWERIKQAVEKARTPK